MPYNGADVIPDLDERGYLPPGVHPATLEEVVERFGRGSEVREAEGQSLLWLAPLVSAAGITRWLVNGSFVTDRAEPNDVDCVLLQGPAYRAGSRAAQRLADGLPFLEIKVVTPRDFEFLVDVLFASDRDGVPKGLVEVMLE
jgi:hypothetical protein